MKYISKMSVETIALLASIKEKDVARREAQTHLDNVKATIKLPSGRTRNGGKADLDDAKAKYDLAHNAYWDSYKKLGAYLRQDMMVTRRQHITEILDVMVGHPNNNVAKEVIKAARTCFVEKEIQTITIKGYSFDVNCELCLDGVMVNISPKGEGRSVCGGLLNVRRKNTFTYNLGIEKMLETITSVNVTGDELHVELPDEYRDEGYAISFYNRDDLEVDYARAVFFLFDACVDIANLLNCYIVESALAHSAYKIER